MQDRYSIEEINARLQPRARDVLIRVFGVVEERSGQIWMRNPGRPDPNFTSFSYCVESGVWKDFSRQDCAGKGLWALIRDFACAGDSRRAFEWAKDFLGLTGKAPDPAEARRFAEQRRRDDEAAQRKAEEQRAKARGLWLSGTPLNGYDAASRYLKGRGIDVRALAGGIPRALRFHHAVYASDRDEAGRGPWPAMLAAIARHGSGVIAVHRTYLEDGPEGASKRVWPGCASGKQVKGAYAGGYIALTRGASDKPLREAEDGEWVQIGEGVEDALSGAVAKPEVRALAAVSVSNMGSLVLPPQIKGAYLLQQNDDGPQAIAEFERAMDKLAERGIEPAIVRMPARFKDINDALVGKQKALA